MRTLALAALTMVTAFGATAADAQGYGARLGRAVPGAPYPVPGSTPVMQQQPVDTLPRPYPGPRQTQGGGGQSGGWQGDNRQGGGTRWGGSVGGHRSGGINAPGGWNAYRRPSRGYTLPAYWTAPSFYIGDFGGYGLYAPPRGYGWQRYYDDAVLIDGRGRVRDVVYGVDWDGGYGDGGYASSDYAYAQGDPGRPGHGYAPQYQGQYQGQYQPLPQYGNVTTYSTGSYYYPGATTTVVTIQSAPSVTTTTTDYIEETTRTRTIAPRRVYHAKKRYYRPARCTCRRVARAEQPILGS